MPGGRRRTAGSGPGSGGGDLEDYENGKLTVRHKIPFSDVRDLPEAELKKLLLADNKPVCFGHSLHDLIQGQIDAGMVITGFFEDGMGPGDPLSGIIDVLIATRALKPSGGQLI